ncbi:MAG: nuclear transport factor 2 family protein [Kordiimonadaceae bacterium]|nr:nuclear transport factor 2 family protein [Kordiimonadaceae bacterium]MBO6568012.1 nuclear transport factor 2 family protein [Kordiimonadaceae bacterium]MBO6964258.1 nuclear transport factor 2 family protein [Kordiimonadaceae bacterium]
MTEDDLMKHLRDLELELASSAARCDDARMDALLADEFVEFGASGRRFTKLQIIELLSTEDDFTPYSLEDFSVTMLGTDNALVTYTIPPREGPDGTPKPGSRRSSIWQEDGDNWRLVFHQGTHKIVTRVWPEYVQPTSTHSFYCSSMPSS